MSGNWKKVVFISLILLLIVSGISGLLLYRYLNEEVTLHLYVSNQSRTYDPADISLSIDGKEEFDRICYTDDSHNWTEVKIKIKRGSHNIEAWSNYTEGPTEKDFTLYNEKWIVVDFWTDPDDDGSGPGFTISIHDEAVAFM